ncbi:hypothetical protein F511_07243 [Dorcoceras hygrometricum]|uniref:Uncharacterized protein n=1 Tax=Dorcoceras hygrometricum TaxID=472368 RepID=A0A2Z7B109_9LAMI|nr:hypothetical protein F511_07243 [Dorcoceras hygrometricum]
MVSSTAASLDGVSPRLEAREPCLPEPEELPNTPWYEEKSSNLKLSDIPVIKEKGGTMGKFEVVLPHPDERAHRPPPSFHTFYMNQIEMGLRFPIPRFISVLCHHIKISPSQLAPNSYSFLLALAVLLSYHKIPLIPYVLMQLVQIKRLGPGKFYISHKGDHTFIKGNPSSHKGWMSRFFYIKCDVKRDPWKCEMSWRDNAFTLTPRTPDRAPSLAPFLEAMRGKSYNAPELIKEYLLCFFKFSRKGVELVGDLSERMGKAELLKAMQEEARASGAAAPPKKTTKKRKAPSLTEKEAHREKRKKEGASTLGAQQEESSRKSRAPTPPTPTSSEIPDLPPVTTIAEAASSGKGPGRTPPFDPSKDSLVDSSSGLVATRYICNMAPDQDLQVLRGPTTLRLWAIAWGGEVVKRLPRAHRNVKASRKNFDKAMGQHAEVHLQHGPRPGSPSVERADDAEAVGHFAANIALFDVLLAKKAWGYFKDGFWGCLAQFRANGYPKEEHPASFLDVQQALAEVGDEEETEEEEEEEEEKEEGEGGDGADANPSNSPQP